MKSGPLKKGKHFHLRLPISDHLSIMFRDLPPDDKKDFYRIDIRKIMDAKRLLKKGLYFNDEQYIKVFEKILLPYYDIVKNRKDKKVKPVKFKI